VINTVSKKTDKQSMWIKKLLASKGGNKTAVAIANKNARILWVLMTRGGTYQSYKYEEPVKQAA